MSFDLKLKFHRLCGAFSLGEYEINSFNFLSFFIQKVLPQLLPFTFGDDPLNTDDVAAVQCMALKGDLPMKIQFFFNDSPITTIASGVHVVMTSPRISQLTIEAVTAHHRGLYRCIAENRAGRSEYAAELRVNGMGTHTHTATIR